MHLKFSRKKQGSQALLLSTLVASSALLGNTAYAETQANQATSGFKNDASLIKAISTDPMTVSPAREQPKLTGESAIVQQINQEQVSRPANKTAQSSVTSVSQLSDVRPTDWAFTALQSLVERYGCIAGYPDRTFRGKQATSRYEFAAGLNACLDKINEIISAGLADKVGKEDLATLQKLQEEFASELATLRGRVDALDAKTAKLEAQQFSTTTKLYGQAIFGLQGRLGNTAKIAGVTVKDPATSVTFGQQVQLSLVTQFSDRSLLLTGLQAGNLNTGADPLTSLYALNNGYTLLGYEGNNTANTFVLSDLTYRFLPTNSLAILVGALGVNAVNVFRGPNRVDESAGSGPISAFAQRNPIIGFNAGQAGLGFDWQINKNFSLQGVYSSGDSATATGDGGLFGGNTSIGVQLAANLFDRLDLAIYYLNSYTNNGRLNNAVGDNIIGSVLPASKFSTNAFGSTVSWNAAKNLNFVGWIGFSSSSIKDSTGSVETFNWMAFSNLLDVFREGDLFGIYVGQPPKITSSNLAGGINYPSLYNGNPLGVAGGQPASTTHVELFYRYPLSRNISITPGVIFLFNPAQNAGSDTVTIGALRTTFSF